MSEPAAAPDEQSLQFAVFADRVRQVRRMLDAGVAPDGAVGDAITPLMESVNEIVDFYDDDRLEMTRLLLAAGADVGRADPTGRTALHYAAGAGQRAVDALVAAGADVDAVDLLGRTALHEAAERECVSAIVALRAAGAAILRDHAGHSPAQLIDLSELNTDELARLDQALGEIGGGRAAARQPDPD